MSTGKATASGPARRQWKRARPAPQVLFQIVAGESVLLDLRSQKYFGLNEVGTRVWQLLQQTDDLLAVRRRLLEEYEVGPAQLDDDLDALIERLLRAGLIEETGDEAAP